MKHPLLRSLVAVALAGISAAIVAGCGNDVPPGAVATVGDSTITQDEFDKWLHTAVAGQAQGGKAVAPDPPDYTKCIAAKKQTPTPKGQKEQTDADLKKQCEREYTQLKNEVMTFLIQAEWVTQEAKNQGVEVSQAAVRTSLEDQKKQAFPNEKAYQQFIKTSGMSEEDILYRVELNQLQDKLTQKVTQDASKVTDEDIQEYYDKNKARFAQPERRDLRIVLTKTEAKAEEAKKALDSGQPWKKVVNKYSIDEASKAQAGLLPAVSKGNQEKALDDAVFQAKKGELQGPVQTQFGWYVFRVEKINAASQQSLEESKDTIKNVLRSERQQKTLDAWVNKFREDYKDKTECADDFRVAEVCSNGPEAEKTGPASGGNPSGPSQGNGNPSGTPQPQQ